VDITTYLDTAIRRDLRRVDQGPEPDASGPVAFKWAISAGGYSSDHCNDMAVDSAGKIYITGHYYHTTTFGTTTLSSRGSEDVLVAKLDGKGRYLWAFSAGGGGLDAGVSIALDGAGSTYVTGAFHHRATFGSLVLTSRGDADFFVAKLDSRGQLQRVVPLGGPSDDSGGAIAVDRWGNRYITGFFHRTVVIGRAVLTSLGAEDIFVAKINDDGW
jgi:hypothetical protein